MSVEQIANKKIAEAIVFHLIDYQPTKCTYFYLHHTLKSIISLNFLLLSYQIIRIPLCSIHSKVQIKKKGESISVINRRFKSLHVISKFKFWAINIALFVSRI